LLFAGAASAAPLSDQGTSTSNSTGTQGDQARTNEKATTGTTGMGASGSSMNGMSAPAKNGMQKDNMQKNESPASQNSGIKQEK